MFKCHNQRGRPTFISAAMDSNDRVTSQEGTAREPEAKYALDVIDSPSGEGLATPKKQKT